jgi:hypothetical protein
VSTDATDAGQGGPAGNGFANAMSEDAHDQGHLPGQYKAWCSKCKAVSEALRPTAR